MPSGNFFAKNDMPYQQLTVGSLVGYIFLPELAVPRRWQTGFLLFPDLTVRKQVEALFHGAVQRWCNADCCPLPTSERTSFTLLLHYSPDKPHMEKFGMWGEVQEGLTAHTTEDLGMGDTTLPLGAGFTSLPKDMCKEYSPKSREARAGVEIY
ncbi:hypothetical protein NQZ68_013718 [Dissostichus eleginoides]|nr:hypothetical protein NQZ68_013718 [Dissostichus eleginoides]